MKKAAMAQMSEVMARPLPGRAVVAGYVCGDVPGDHAGGGML